MPLGVPSTNSHSGGAAKAGGSGLGRSAITAIAPGGFTGGGMSSGRGGGAFGAPAVGNIGPGPVKYGQVAPPIPSSSEFDRTEQSTTAREFPAGRPNVTDTERANMEAQPVLEWLKAQMGIVNQQQQDQLRGIMGTAVGNNAYATYQQGNAASQYGITSQGIANDLLYGNMRNDLDLQRANGVYALLQQELGNKRGTAQATWDELQRNNQANVGFAGRDRDIRDWLNFRNTGYNATDKRNADREVALTHRKESRRAMSSATSRGIVGGSRGIMDEMGEIDTARDNSLNRNKMNFEKTRDGLTAENRQSSLTYDRQIEQLLNQLNNGQISYKDAMASIGNALASGQLNRDIAAQLHGINAGQNAANAGTAGQQATLNRDVAQNNAGWNAWQQNRGLLNQYLNSGNTGQVLQILQQIMGLGG